MKKGDIIIAGLGLLVLVIWSSVEGLTGFLLGYLVWWSLSIWAIIDMAKAQPDTGYRIPWLFIVLFLSGFGATLYYIFEARRRQS